MVECWAIEDPSCIDTTPKCGFGMHGGQLNGQSLTNGFANRRGLNGCTDSQATATGMPRTRQGGIGYCLPKPPKAKPTLRPLSADTEDADRTRSAK